MADGFKDEDKNFVQSAVEKRKVVERHNEDGTGQNNRSGRKPMSSILNAHGGGMLGVITAREKEIAVIKI